MQTGEEISGREYRKRRDAGRDAVTAAPTRGDEELDPERDRKPRGVGAAPGGPRPRSAAQPLPNPREDTGEPLGPAEGPTGWRSIPLFGARFKPLAKREMTDEALVEMREAIQKYGELLDDGIPLLSRTHRPVVIWGNLADEDADVIVEALLILGQRWGVAAQVVRGIQRTYTYLELGLITGPRFKQTLDYYIENGFVFSIRLGRGNGQRRTVTPAPVGKGVENG